jgi:hypothetical protein
MRERRTDEWRIASKRWLRFFGLSGQPGAASMGLAAVLIVAGAAVLAVAPRHGIAVAIGAALWLVGAVIAIRGWLRIMRDQRTKSN